MQPGRFTERRTKAANYHAHAGETIAGRLVRGANGRFGASDASADPAKTQADAAATIAQNRALNAAAAKPGGHKRRAAKPKKAKAPKKGHAAKPHKGHVKHPRSASGKRRDLARQVMHHARVAKALGLEEDAAGSLLDLAQGKKVTDDGGLEKIGLAVLQKDGSYLLTAAGAAVAKAADAGDVKAARTVMDAISSTTKEAGHTGVMLAFFLPSMVAGELVRQAGAVTSTPEPAEDLHLTLAYLGKTDTLGDSKFQLLAAAERYARYASAIIGSISGIGRFDTDEGDGTNALYASFDAPDLSAWRDNLLQELANQSGTLPTANHGYTPHITLAYIPTDAPTPTIPVAHVPITFDTLTLAWGDERFDFPLLRSSPMVFKDATGRWRWVTFSSTAYRDRDGEIVSTKALSNDVARADADGDYGPLRWWHMPGVDIGDCDFNAMTGRVLVESGTFRDEQVGARIKAAAPDLHVSIGFHHAPTEPVDGVFSSIRRFERSLLPAGRASNPYTRLVVQETPSMDQPKQDALKALLGNDQLLEQLLIQADQTTKAADAAGVVFKEAEVAPEVTADDALDDGDIAVGDMSPDEFGGLLRIANQPLVDALGAFAAAITGTAAQTATKEAAIDTRLAEVETKAAAVPDLATQLATTKASLEAAQAEIAELKGDVPRSLSERRASQSPATVITKEHPLASDDAQPRGDPNFINSFVLGQPVQQGA